MCGNTYYREKLHIYKSQVEVSIGEYPKLEGAVFSSFLELLTWSTYYWLHITIRLTSTFCFPQIILSLFLISGSKRICRLFFRVNLSSQRLQRCPRTRILWAVIRPSWHFQWAWFDTDSKSSQAEYVSHNSVPYFNTVVRY